KRGYRPWLTVKNAAKFSRRSLILGLKSNRLHHLLSDGELFLFQIQEAKPFVVDMFEQMPLLDVERCISIAQKLGFRYPTDKDDNAVVMSTDLVIKSLDPLNRNEPLTAHTFKYSSDLKQGTGKKRSINRTLQKLLIEKQYWNDVGV